MTTFEKLNTYLGQKGYTLVKNELTIEQQKQIRNDLTIKPSNHGMPGLTNQTTFPAYRESLKKIYVPHYYGVENFGQPKEIKITQGESIDLEFKGNLRENQEVVVKTYLDHVLTNPVGGGLFELPCAYGKTVIAINIISKLKKKNIYYCSQRIFNESMDRENISVFTRSKSRKNSRTNC